MLLRFLSFLERNSLFNIGIVIIYYVLVVFPHNHFGTWLNEYFKPLGRDTYNLIVITLGGIGLLSYFLLIRKGFKYHAKIEDKLYRAYKKNIIGYLLFTLFLILIAINTLLVINIEIIHFPQYAILAILLFPVYWDLIATLFWTVVLGFLDEAYQYWVLNPEYNYFDFNDIILDLLGAILGLLLIASHSVVKYEDNTTDSYLEKIYRYFKKQPTIFWGLLVSFLFFPITYCIGWLRIFPMNNGEEVPIQLIRNYNPAFWQTVPKGFTFHVIQPLEGLGILIILFSIYIGLGRNSIQRIPRSNHKQ